VRTTPTTPRTDHSDLFFVKDLIDGCSQLNATHKSCGAIALSSMKWNFECCAREGDYHHDRFTQRCNDFRLMKSRSRRARQRIAASEGMAPATIGTAAMHRANCSAAADRVTAMTITRNGPHLVRQGLHPGRETKWK
jgi:hypothetical protein